MSNKLQSDSSSERRFSLKSKLNNEILLASSQSELKLVDVRPSEKSIDTPVDLIPHELISLEKEYQLLRSKKVPFKPSPKYQI